MGLYLRKSFRAGPIRFNLSKSGLGISGGVKGAAFCDLQYFTRDLVNVSPRQLGEELCGVHFCLSSQSF
jgi:Protein of unknown function (DUF4236)